MSDSKPTTADSIDFLTRGLKGCEITELSSKHGFWPMLESIRAQLLAAQEMKKALEDYEQWRDGHTRICGYNPLPQDFESREKLRKSLVDWKAAGGE